MVGNAAARQTPEYLAVHPFGKLPAAECDDGTPIFESGAILLYMADKAFVPTYLFHLFEV
jgi:glutathione S-transferase